jgi:hypothetical protein
MKERTYTLEEMHESYVIDEIRYLQKMKDPKEKRFRIGFLNLNNEGFALHSMYVLHNFQKARNDFYKAAVCGEYMVTYYDELMDTTIYKICSALLSDNSRVIYHYSTLRNKAWSNTFIGHQFNASIQAVLLDDDQELEIQLGRMQKTVQTKKWSGSAGYHTVFNGMLHRNKSQIEDGLQELVKTFGSRGEFGLAKKYFSFDITALAKLAWRKRLEIKVESSLVPMAMLPICEQDSYQGYDFFKELDMEYS